MLPSIYTFHLNISDYQLVVANDVMRLFIIQLTSQILFTVSRDSSELFSQVFLESTLFILLGVLVYWLVFNHFITFTNKEASDEVSIDNYYQSVSIQ